MAVGLRESNRKEAFVVSLESAGARGGKHRKEASCLGYIQGITFMTGFPLYSHLLSIFPYLLSTVVEPGLHQSKCLPFSFIIL